MSACATACSWLVRLDLGAGRPTEAVAALVKVGVERLTTVVVGVTRSTL